MQAMILAAGLGTRLKELTSNKPKALVEVNGRTLLEIAINNLTKYGFDKIIINVHHFADLVKDYLDKNIFDAEIIISDESGLLLDTGGAIKQAQNYFDDSPILIHNVDIISNLNLKKLYDFHLSHYCVATLFVSERESSRYLLFDNANFLCGWQDIKMNKEIIVRNENELKQLAFNGIHIINPAAIKYFPEEKVFSVINAYLKIAETKNICGFKSNNIKWIDVGKIESLQQASELYKYLN